MKVPVEELPGVELVDGVRHADPRGAFAKALDGRFAADQLCSAENVEAGTVRGLHYQARPAEETKQVWCLRGSVLDVLVDVRPESPAFGSWAAVTLDAGTPRVLTVPPGVAHGYQTLVDDSTLLYLIAGAHDPARARTLRWDDPTVGIAWSLPVTRMSAKDREGTPWPPAY